MGNWKAGLAGLAGITENLKKVNYSITDLLTTSNQEMLAHLKTSIVSIVKISTFEILSLPSYRGQLFDILIFHTPPHVGVV